MSAAEIDAASARMEESFKDKPAEQLETAKSFLAGRVKSTYQPVEVIEK